MPATTMISTSEVARHTSATSTMKNSRAGSLYSCHCTPRSASPRLTSVEFR
jgi:metal-dependent hydrolase (beta-lactamase superfamily II)